MSKCNWGQHGQVVRALDLNPEVLGKLNKILFCSLAGIILGSPKLNPSATFINGQLTIGFFNHVMCILNILF